MNEAEDKAMKNIFLILIIIPNISFAKSYLPSGCGTYVKCNTNGKYGEPLNGPQTCFNAGNDKIKIIEALWKNDLLEGHFWCGSDEGTPKVKAQYVNGELDGEYQEYDPKLKTWGLTQFYKKGQQEGFKTRLLPDGRKLVSLYKNDKQLGYEIVLNSDGTIHSKRQCKINGASAKAEDCDKVEIPGLSKQMDKHLVSQKEDKQKQDNRAVETRWKNGKIKSQYRMIKGQVEGDEVFNFENGKPQLITIHKNGKKIFEKEYFKEGQLKRESSYSENYLKEETNYFQNGKKESEISVDTSEKYSTSFRYKFYYDNGQLLEKGGRLAQAKSWNLNGQLHGEIFSYLKDGKALSEKKYDKGKPVGLWKTWTKKYYIEDKYLDSKLAEKTFYDIKNIKKQLRKLILMPDGSIRSDMKDPAFKDEDEEK